VNRWKKRANGRAKHVSDQFVNPAGISAPCPALGRRDWPTPGDEFGGSAYLQDAKGDRRRRKYFGGKAAIIFPTRRGQRVPPGLSDENIEECRNAVSRRVFIMEVIAMFTAFIIVTVFTAAANTYAAIVDFRRPQWVLDNMTKWGGSHSWLFTLGALKAAGALGLLIGIGVPLIGVAAAVGLVLFLLAPLQL
jgi:DoxX-like protein